MPQKSKLKISDEGLNLIRSYEGLRLDAYLCPAGVLTIGYGHTGPDVKKGMVISGKDALKLLQEDVKQSEDVVNSVVSVPLTQNQFDALVSFVFNLGSGAFKSSSLLKRLNEGKYSMAGDEFLRWTFATVNGKLTRLEGLVKRRKAERDLFLRS